MPEIQSLELVSLREARPNEAQDSTPWLANNIDRLGAALDPRLERVQKEVTLPRAVGWTSAPSRQNPMPGW